MQFDNKKFNVLVRGKHTLFVVTEKKPDGSLRDPELLRKQLANMLSTDLRSVIPNHDYDGLPEGKWLCYRYKGAIPTTLRRPSIAEGKHLFIGKDEILNFVDETKPVKKTNAVLEAMPGTDGEPAAREEAAAPMPPIGGDTMAAVLMRLIDRQDKFLERQDEMTRQMEMLAEIIRLAALKGKI